MATTEMEMRESSTIKEKITLVAISAREMKEEEITTTTIEVETTKKEIKKEMKDVTSILLSLFNHLKNMITEPNDRITFYKSILLFIT